MNKYLTLAGIALLLLVQANYSSANIQNPTKLDSYSHKFLHSNEPTLAPLQTKRKLSTNTNINTLEIQVEAEISTSPTQLKVEKGFPPKDPTIPQLKTTEASEEFIKIKSQYIFPPLKK